MKVGVSGLQDNRNWHEPKYHGDTVATREHVDTIRLFKAALISTF